MHLVMDSNPFNELFSILLSIPIFTPGCFLDTTTVAAEATEITYQLKGHSMEMDIPENIVQPAIIFVQDSKQASFSSTDRRCLDQLLRTEQPLQDLKSSQQRLEQVLNLSSKIYCYSSICTLRE